MLPVCELSFSATRSMIMMISSNEIHTANEWVSCSTILCLLLPSLKITLWDTFDGRLTMPVKTSCHFYSRWLVDLTSFEWLPYMTRRLLACCIGAVDFQKFSCSVSLLYYYYIIVMNMHKLWWICMCGVISGEVWCNEAAVNLGTSGRVDSAFEAIRTGRSKSAQVELSCGVRWVAWLGSVLQSTRFFTGAPS